VRPVVVMSNDVCNRKFADFIAIPLTSNMKLRYHTVVITSAELETGKLIVDSRAKVDKVFSVQQSLVRKKIGRVKKSVYEKLKQILFEIIG
jgi:mRNA-degrading endonuclease toxin of MazEF toxin-antitoxin module